MTEYTKAELCACIAEMRGECVHELEYVEHVCGRSIYRCDKCNREIYGDLAQPKPYTDDLNHAMDALKEFGVFFRIEWGDHHHGEGADTYIVRIFTDGGDDGDVQSEHETLAVAMCLALASAHTQEPCRIKETE